MRMSAGTTAINTSRMRRTRSPYLGDELRGDFSLCRFFTLGVRCPLLKAHSRTCRLPKKTASSLLARQSNRKQRVRHQPEIEAGEEFSVHFAKDLGPRKMAMQIFFYF